MQPDNDFMTGQRAARNGRYDLAVAAFERARSKPDLRDTADGAAFQALREVDISRYLVGQIYRRLGRPVAQYRGFDAIDPPLDQAAVTAKLRALATADGAARRRWNSVLLADRLERGGEIEPLDSSATEHPALATSLARRALARGDIAAFDQALAQLDRQEAPVSARQMLRARAMLARGSGHAAAQAFNLALLYLDSAADGERVRYRRNYRGYEVIHFKGEFYAIPADQCPVTTDDDGQDSAIIAHRVPARLRALVLRLCPLWLVDLLRQIMTRMPLRRRLSLDEMTRSSDLIDVLQRIDSARNGGR